MEVIVVNQNLSSTLQVHTVYLNILIAFLRDLPSEVPMVMHLGRPSNRTCSILPVRAGHLHN
jgi:hypothetical protein